MRFGTFYSERLAHEIEAEFSCCAVERQLFQQVAMSGAVKAVRHQVASRFDPEDGRTQEQEGAIESASVESNKLGVLGDILQEALDDFGF